MANKVRVYGKAQNRTALGIANAYMVMFPHATLDDLRKAFPNSVCPDSGVKEVFVPLSEAESINTKHNMSLYFAKPDEVITTGDGQQVCLNQVWSKPSFDNMVAQGELYGIVIAEFEKTMKSEKGGYRLEYLDGYVPPVPEEPKKKKSLWWLWLIIVLLLGGVIAYLMLKPKDVQVVEVEKEKIVEKEVIVRDTVFVQQIEDIERDFNAAQFEKGKSDLNDDAKLALHDLAKVLKQNENLKLKIKGHTSSEGSEATNQKLSESRAQAAVDFLVNKEGIDASRLEAVGMGSSEPIDPNNLEANRRTEFEIVEE